MSATKGTRLTKIPPRYVLVKCENCGEFPMIQRYDPPGCPTCGFPVKVVEPLEESQRKSA